MPDRVTDEQLDTYATNPHRAGGLEISQMAWELHASRARIAELEAIVEAVRTALAQHPRCDVHPDDDVITCGWKLAVAGVQRALDTTEVTDRG